MPTGVTSFPGTYKSYANNVRAIVENSYNKANRDSFSGIFYQDSTESWEDKIQEMGSIGDYERWEDNTSPSTADFAETYAQTFVQVPFGKRVPIGRLFRKFEGRDVRSVRRSATQLGRFAARTQQLEMGSVLGYGASDTNTYLTGLYGSSVSALGPDGKRLFSTLHPCSPTNATTWSNADGSNVDAGVAGVDSLLNLLYFQKDDQGRNKYYGTDGVVILSPRGQFDDLMKAVHGDLEPETLENNIQVKNNKMAAQSGNGYYNGFSIEIRLVPWLDNFSTTAFYAIAKEVVDEEMPLVRLSSQPFATDQYVNDDTKTLYVEGSFIDVVGFLSGRGVAYSAGTGTGTYTA